jgi:hypothetical protein
MIGPKFCQIARSAEALSARDLIIDGEATVLGTTGLPDFQELRRELAQKHSGRVIYQAFDLLYLDGQDLRNVPLIERKHALQDVLAKAPSTIGYAESVEQQDGHTVFRHACKLGVEGIVSKRRHSPYRSGRPETWIKLKCTKSDTFPIVAFVEKAGRPPPQNRLGLCRPPRRRARALRRQGRHRLTPRRSRASCGKGSMRYREEIAACGASQETQGDLGPADRGRRNRIRADRRRASARGGVQRVARRFCFAGGACPPLVADR